MASQISIERLAQDLGTSSRDLLLQLERMGFGRFRSARQTLPAAVARQVSQSLVLQEPPAAVPAATNAFEQAMAAAGVTPLQSRGSNLAGPPQAGRVAAPVRVAQEQAQQEPDPAAAARDEAPSAPDPTEILKGRLVEQQEQVRALESEKASLQERLALLRLEKGELASSLLRHRQERIGEDERALQGVPGSRSLLGVLAERGLRGVDEASLALRALLESHLIDPSLPYLDLRDHRRLGRLLGDRLCLLCGSADCAAPQGATLVRVPASRCELCGGEDLRAVFERFSDACLLGGLTRVVLVGGRAWMGSWMRERVDRRVALRCVAGDRCLAAEQASAEVEWAQLLVLWDDGKTLVEVKSAFGSGACPRVRICSPTAGGALRHATEAIEALDVDGLVLA